MSNYEIANLIIQAIAGVAIVATFGVYFHQLRTMQGQLTAARNASRSQNLLALVDYIQRPEHRAARTTFFAIAPRPFPDWSTEERKQAELACSAWDAVGPILRNTDIPGAADMIVGNWRHSIWRCHSLAADLKDNLRKERDPDFWDDLQWLAEKALEGYRVEGASLRPIAGGR